MSDTPMIRSSYFEANNGRDKVGTLTWDLETMGKMIDAEAFSESALFEYAE